MAHRYGRMPHELVPGVVPGSWGALIVDVAVYQAGEAMRVAAAQREGAIIFPVWGL